MANNIYIGNRYVPIFADPVEWDNLRTYEPLTIVTYHGTSYTSRKTVPVGIALNNTEYWVVTGNFNAFINELQGQIDDINSDIESINDKVNGSILVIGNSYVQRNVTLKLQDTFAHSYRKTYGGSGFVSRTDNTTTYIDLLDQAIADDSIPKDKITDVIFVSAMGDTWGLTAQGESTYKTALNTSLSLIKNKIETNFPNCRRTMVTLAEARNAVYFSDDRYDSLFILHRFFKELCVKNDLEYLGWTGWNAMFSGSGNFEIDNYHPTVSGASLIGQNILNAYRGCLEYVTLTSSYNCDFNLTSAGTIGVQIYINPNHETIICRVANITAGAQTVAVGDVLINLKQLPIPPIAPLDQNNVYLQGNFNTLGGKNDLTRLTCTLANDNNGVATLKLSNVTDGTSIGSSQGIIPEWNCISFDL